MNQYNQPIGEEVLDWKKREQPGSMYYTGKYTIVTRLKDTHIEGLYKHFENSHPSNWTYLPEEPPENYEEFKQIVQSKAESSTPLFYVVINKASNEPIGFFSLMRVDQKNGVIEVGHINFSDSLRRTKMSTEAHFLLASYVFDELQYRRYEWKCDALNAPSKKTAERLGFQYEGTFRNSVVYKQRSRDTNWFSMLREEWPIHKNAMKQWLAEENFDDEGVQKQRLEAFRSQNN